jgi:hypothetical protein
VTPTSSPERALARRLLARETGAHATPGEAVAASDRLLRPLHAQLAHWLGQDGSHAVLARALDRTRVGHPSLADATLDPRGERLLAVPADSIRDRDSAEVTEALVALISALLALLTRLIGADLVTRLLQQVWPNGTLDDVWSETPGSLPDEVRMTARADEMRTPNEDAPSE